MNEALRHYIQDELLSGHGATPIADDDDLLASGVDSVGMMTLVLYIEEHWSLAIPPEDVLIENFQSINAIESYLQNRLDAK